MRTVAGKAIWSPLADKGRVRRNREEAAGVVPLSALPTGLGGSDRRQQGDGGTGRGTGGLSHRPPDCPTSATPTMSTRLNTSLGICREGAIPRLLTHPLRECAISSAPNQ